MSEEAFGIFTEFYNWEEHILEHILGHIREQSTKGYLYPKTIRELTPHHANALWLRCGEVKSTAMALRCQRYKKLKTKHKDTEE
jgi:hypothetical protein